MTYDAVGSEAGIQRLLRESVDFGASDDPDIFREIGPGAESKYRLFPSVIGAVVPIINLPGLTRDVAFTPQALAGIYLGSITKWNDPAIREANPGTALPDLDIVVVHRTDGSGTSYAWSNYLSRTSPQWRSQVGVSSAPKWPVGRPASGNEGVAKLVKELGGSIGYVEYIYAFKNHLSVGRVQNETGEFIAADLESIAAATANSPPLGSDFKGSIVNSPGKSSYPIVTFTWFVVPAHIADAAKRNALAGFLRWMLGPGQRQAAALGYLALPASLVTREEAVISEIR